MHKKHEILTEKVASAIKRLKINKSPGTDNVTGEMIKYDDEKVKKEIYSLCNRVSKEGKALEDRKSILVLIHTKEVHWSTKLSNCCSDEPFGQSLDYGVVE